MQVGVIMGGVSSERDISMLSGKYIIDNLDRKKYEVLPIPINTQYELIDRVKCVQFAFIALHGEFGEDGTVQAMLKSMDVPFSGSNVMSSALCMDKDATKKMLVGLKVPTPKWIMVKKGKEFKIEDIEKIPYPLVVKPNNGGSSIGVNIVSNREGLIEALKTAFEFDEEIIIEEFIGGEEVTCCILDGKLLPVLSIKPKKDAWFDYKSKYEDKGAEEIVVKLDKEVEDEIKKMTKVCWENLKLKVYARIDVIIKDKKPYVLEINTLPGMTQNSLFPKSAKAAGISFPKLLDEIIKLSLR
ncbi:D-alanine--D-alanine ligase [Haloimpatiens sp. FM7315]|uniref:D-alanine--D-alanine ligase n=1 Tax=Haloimpatiens sp. FM7315 TaxID=3298609 RepID=UPI003709FD30